MYLLIVIVPDKVTSKDFWQRFYFSQHEAEEVEKKRASILARKSYFVVESVN